jgi:hypothetical protein
MTIFLEFWTSLTNYENIGAREISSAPTKPQSSLQQHFYNFTSTPAMIVARGMGNPALTS